jgi:hypothetical protein
MRFDAETAAAAEAFGRAIDERLATGPTARAQERNRAIDAADDRASVAPVREWPTPPDPVAYHGLAGDIVGAIEPHTEADPVALLVQLLVAFGSVVGRRPHCRAEADRHGVNLYAALVGTSAKGRKGTSWGHIRRIVDYVDPDWRDRVQAGLSSGEGLIHAVRDAVVKGEETVDEGVRDKRLLALESEFASTLRVLARDGNTLSAIIRTAWDTGDLGTLTKASPARATGAHIAIITHCTKDELLRFLTATESANGFANRFLWACVRRSKVLPEGGRIAEVNFAPLLRRLNEAATFAMHTDEIRRDEGARALWHAVYPDLSEGRPGLLGAITARAEAQVVRLSAIYALLERSPVVTETHLEAALAVWDYSERSAAYIFGESLGDPVADEILRALRQTPEGMSRTDIRDLFGRNRSGAELGRALGVLAEHGLIRRADPERSEAGRPAEIWKAVATTKTTDTTKPRPGTAFGRLNRFRRSGGGERHADDGAAF